MSISLNSIAFALKIRKQKVNPTGICDEGDGLVAVLCLGFFKFWTFIHAYVTLLILSQVSQMW